MKKIIPAIIIITLLAGRVSAQSCSQFINALNGKTLTYANNGTDGKAQGKMVYVTRKKNETTVNLQGEMFDKTGKSIGTGESEVICTGNTIKLDMKSFLPASSMKMFGNMELSGDAKYLTYPVDLKVGQKLEDGTVSININNNGSPMGKLVLNINNRKVEKAEKVTTAAGSFDCFKINDEVTLNISMMGATVPFQLKITEWFAPKLGRFAKSETRDKTGKLMTTTTLESIK